MAGRGSGSLQALRADDQGVTGSGLASASAIAWPSALNISWRIVMTLGTFSTCQVPTSAEFWAEVRALASTDHAVHGPEAEHVLASLRLWTRSKRRLTRCSDRPCAGIQPTSANHP